MNTSDLKRLLIRVLFSVFVLTTIAAENGDTPSTKEATNAKQYVYVFGEVLRPNRYRWTNGLTFLDALESAGGYTDYGAYTQIEIRRIGTSTQTVSYAEALHISTKNPLLKPGDSVVVPRSETQAAKLFVAGLLRQNNPSMLSGGGNWVLVEGAVKHPQKVPWTNGMTLSNAIELAGGTTDAADLGGVKVHHFNGGSELADSLQMSKKPTMKMTLFQGDRVTIPEKEAKR